MINKITEADIAEFEAYATLDRYQNIATKSAIYPGQGTLTGLMYVALKGCGEAGEFAEHVGKAMRDDHYGEEMDRDPYNCPIYCPLTEERKRLLIKEIGDELWYLSAKCNELGISLSEVASANLKKLHDRTNRDMLQGSGDER